jgi:hypothetical protein
LVDDLLSGWQKILSDMRKVNFTPDHDSVVWKVAIAGLFSVKSVYNAMTSDESGPSHSKIWKSKIPAKIKIFLWLLLNNVILTKDNLIKRKWIGDPTCYFCDQDESVSHLFFHCSTAKAVWAIVAHCIGANNIPNTLNQCWTWCECWLPAGKQFHTLGIAAICWAIWKTRNKCCFEGRKIKNPAEIICYACALMTYWAGLFPEMDKEELQAGVTTMLQIATKLILKSKQGDGTLLLKESPDDSSQG